MNENIDDLIDRFSDGRITRRQLIAGLLCIFAAGGVSQTSGDEAGESSPFKAAGLDHIALRVTDVPRSRDFYRDLLGMRVTRGGGENSCFLAFEHGFLALFRGEEPRMDHYCYAVEDYNVRHAEEKLRAAGIIPRIRGNRIYFEDPDGHTVQLAAGLR